MRIHPELTAAGFSLKSISVGGAWRPEEMVVILRSGPRFRAVLYVDVHALRVNRVDSWLEAGGDGARRSLDLARVLAGLPGGYPLTREETERLREKVFPRVGCRFRDAEGWLTRHPVVAWPPQPEVAVPPGNDREA